MLKQLFRIIRREIQPDLENTYIIKISNSHTGTHLIVNPDGFEKSKNANSHFLTLVVVVVDL